MTAPSLLSETKRDAFMEINERQEQQQTGEENTNTSSVEQFSIEQVFISIKEVF